MNTLNAYFCSMLENDKFYEKKIKKQRRIKGAGSSRTETEKDTILNRLFWAKKITLSKGGDEEVNKADIWKKVFQAKKQKGTVGSVLIMFKEEKVSWRKK